MIESLYQVLHKTQHHIEQRTGVQLHKSEDGRYPQTPAELRISGLFNQWWYYSIELMPRIVTKGFYPTSLPMIPRMMLRKCDLRHTSCLDLGSMEGLVPVLMCRGGASSVLATDATDHCVEKMDAVKHYFNVNFDYKSVGLMYSLCKKLANKSFDLINCSGLLYHVFSPLTVLSGVRPLLKKNGLMIISTNVILAKGFSMEFNNEGRMQKDTNTFWYMSVELLDYILRYLKLAPIDCIHLLHSDIKSNVSYVFNKPSGYVSVLCRATNDVLPTKEDQWMSKSAKSSWEHCTLSNWELVKQQPKSSIQCKSQIDKQHYRKDIKCLDLWKAINQNSPVTTNKESDSHTLRLSDNS
jgi:2-polyprenyl-3-methyl-5-hydroxy-6-metoxy-1,4-benzoquinol methylase